MADVWDVIGDVIGTSFFNQEIGGSLSELRS